GSPVFYCFVCAPLDMKSGGFVSGSPEYGLLSVAGAEMARHYGLPSMMGGLGNTAKSPGIQLGYEKGITTTAAALAGCDLLVGMGGLDDSLFVSMEQLLIDAEIWEQVTRTAQGLEVNASEIALDVIEAVGPRGQYLGHPHTLANFRRLYMPTYACRASYEAWVAAGKKEMYDVAHVAVEKILATHRPEPLPEDVRRRLAEIETDASKTLT
ncbi:MAG: trimethylamine methyltransferase family protein, partial [Thermoplasmata archaeon]